MADSQTKTGEEIIGKLSKEMLLAVYDDDDIREDYIELRRRLTDKKTTNRDFATLLRLAWDFRIPKPKQELEVEGKGNMQIIINENILDEPGKSQSIVS